MTHLLTTRAIDIEIDDYDWPRCTVCSMPVESFRVFDTGDSLIFEAQCHGEVELATFPDDMWDTVIGTHVAFGPAFNNGSNNGEKETLDLQRS